MTVLRRKGLQSKIEDALGVNPGSHRKMGDPLDRAPFIRLLQLPLPIPHLIPVACVDRDLKRPHVTRPDLHLRAFRPRAA